MNSSKHWHAQVYSHIILIKTAEGSIMTHTFQKILRPVELTVMGQGLKELYFLLACH